ncbi:HAD hydrolase family protein [Thomasclavelia saccharogumia]
MRRVGLEKLCQYLHISMVKVIVVGDTDNDMEALKSWISNCNGKCT